VVAPNMVVHKQAMHKQASHERRTRRRSSNFTKWSRNLPQGPPRDRSDILSHAVKRSELTDPN
jgi:hypothetical protein